jgi:hypothetical protein
MPSTSVGCELPENIWTCRILSEFPPSSTQLFHGPGRGASEIERGVGLCKCFELEMWLLTFCHESITKSNRPVFH